MNMQKTINNISVRYDRFKKNTRFKRIPIKSFDFEKGLKSIDLIQEFFINKSKNPKEDAYNKVFNMYLCYLENDYSFLNEFVCDELLLDNKTKRLLRILKAVQKTKYNEYDLKNIFKLNNKSNPELHFFIKRKKDEFLLLLVDLYHLGIYGDKIVNGKRIKISLKEIYNNNKYNKCSLEQIPELLYVNC